MFFEKLGCMIGREELEVADVLIPKQGSDDLEDGIDVEGIRRGRRIRGTSAVN